MSQPVFSFLSSLLDIGDEYLVRKPLFILGKQGIKVRYMFLKLPRTQAVTIYAGILWVIPIALVSPFTSPYMTALGFSDTEVGAYQSSIRVIPILFLILGGYLTDTWGRKQTLIFFDFISWGAYSLLLALAFSKWWCVAALLVFTSNFGSNPPYQCLLIEGVKEKKRAIVYTVLAMVNLSPALFFLPLLGGIWVEKRGLIEANHEMYWLQLVMTMVGMWLRLKYLPSTGQFEQAPGAWWHAFRDGSRQYYTAMKDYFKKPAAKVILASKFIDEWILFIWGIYSSLYFTHYLGMKVSYLSILGPVSAYVAFLVLFIVIPSIPSRKIMKILGVDQIFGLFALGVLLLLTKGGGNVLLVALFSAGFGAAGVVLYASVSLAAWMSIIGEKERAKVYSVSWAFIMVGIAITGPWASYLYGHVSPVALIWLMMGLRVIAFLLLRRAAAILSPAGPAKIPASPPEFPQSTVGG